MKHNYSSFSNTFCFQKKLFILSLLYFPTIYGALVLHPQQQVPQFQKEGFQIKDAFKFKENLAIITSCFDTTGKTVLKKLNSVVKAHHEHKITENLKKTHPNASSLWETHSENKNFQVVSFDEKLKWYFENEQSEYKIKLDEFKQAKNLLLEILRYVSHERYFENALLKLDELVNKLETYNYKDLKPEVDETTESLVRRKIEHKMHYIQKKMIEISLIIEFKNRLFRFLQNYFEIMNYNKGSFVCDPFILIPNELNYSDPMPLILKHIKEKEQKIWNHDLNMNNHFGYLSPVIQGKEIIKKTYNTMSDLVQYPKKTFARFFLNNETVNATMQQTQITINTCNTNLLNFADIEMDKLANQIKLIANLMNVANKPAVWKFSTFLVKMLPRLLINCISTQPQTELTPEQEKNLVEEKKKFAVENLKKAAEKLQKGKRDVKSVTKILEHLIRATGSFYPAIEFLNEIQIKAFNNELPHTIAVYIFEMRDFLMHCSDLVKDKVDVLKGIRQTLESDAKNKRMAQKTTSPADWAQIFKTINIQTAKMFRKEFYKYSLPILPFLSLKRKNRPIIDADGEPFYSNENTMRAIAGCNNELIQDHLNAVYQYVNQINRGYLQKIIPLLALQKKVDFHTCEDPEYGKMLLFLAALKDCKAPFKVQDQTIPHNQATELEKTNFEKFFYNALPGTQNLKYSIKNDTERLSKEITKKDKLKPEYNNDREFLRQFNINNQFYKDDIEYSNRYYTKKVFTMVAFQIFKLLSYFIDREKLLMFCDKFHLLPDHIILTEQYKAFLNKYENQKKSAEKSVAEYEKIYPLIQKLNQTINEKENIRADLKKFRKTIKTEIDTVWSLE